MDKMKTFEDNIEKIVNMINKYEKLINDLKIYIENVSNLESKEKLNDILFLINIKESLILCYKRQIKIIENERKNKNEQ